MYLKPIHDRLFQYPFQFIIHSIIVLYEGPVWAIIGVIK